MPLARTCGNAIDYVPGISHAYGGALSALSITYTLTPSPSDSTGQKAWTEKEVVKALYVDQEVILAEDERAVIGDFH